MNKISDTTSLSLIDLKEGKMLAEGKPNGEVKQYIWKTHDGHTIETGIWRYYGQRTRAIQGINKKTGLNLFKLPFSKKSWPFDICISSQVGCAMGCTFCASGRPFETGGPPFIRDLTSDEIIAQVQEVENQLNGLDKINEVNFAGIGEPLQNYDGVVAAAKILSKKYRLQLTTCGIIPQIYKLADEDFDIKLTYSLHAPQTEIRRELMPINKKYPFEEVLKSLDYFISKKKAGVEIKYLLLEGVTDSPKLAEELVTLFSDIPVTIVLQMFNQIPFNNFRKTSVATALEFQDILTRNKIKNKLVYSGSDLDVSCGQMRWETLREQKNLQIL